MLVELPWAASETQPSTPADAPHLRWKAQRAWTHHATRQRLLAMALAASDLHRWQKLPSYSHGFLVPPVSKLHQYYPSIPSDTGRVSRRSHHRSLSPGKADTKSLHGIFEHLGIGTKVSINSGQ